MSTTLTRTTLLATVAAGLALALWAPSLSSAEANADAATALQRQFDGAIHPFVQKYCQSCHGGDEPEALLDLTDYSTFAAATDDLAVWEIVLERLEAGDMPPEEADAHPTDNERRAAVEWIRAVREYEAARMSGDPGPVLARRLSAAEYNYTIRDLTGVDIQPASEFPIDPANQAGFDNSGESLSMSPALLKKYLGAARLVAEHLVIQPDGFTFAPHPVATATDRDKYCVRRIVEFYERQPTDYADYFYAAWELDRTHDADRSDEALQRYAQSRKLSSKYFPLVYQLLTDGEDECGPVADLRKMWQSLPSDVQAAEKAHEGCEAMRDFILEFRPKLQPTFEPFDVRAIHIGSQPFVMWRNRRRAESRMTCNLAALHVDGESIQPLETDGEEVNRDAQTERRQRGRRSDRRDRREEAPPDPALEVPANEYERALHVAAFQRFCAVFPSAFYIKERGRDYAPTESDEKEGRLLSAGFHSMMGYFRDDEPLCELILDEQQRRELDAMWDHLDFFALAPIRQHTGFVWFERTDSRFMNDERFYFARAEDKDVTSEEKMQRLADVYAEKAREVGAGTTALQAIADHFDYMNSRIRWIEATHAAAENSHLESLVEFAQRAYRRPLSEVERVGLIGFYQSLRTKYQLDHEQALQDSLVSVLMSPNFCYRYELTPAGEGVQPLTDYELASRLSYFLWSSMPDEELLILAEAGALHDPDVLRAQAARMVRDSRIRALAVEFGGNWLDFRRFQQHNSVDRERFPAFTDELRDAMFEEPVRFFLDVVRHDRSVLEFLDGRHTFVNQVLAAHYGMEDLPFDDDDARKQWLRVDDAQQYQRGGLPPMAVFLTKNAPGLRTSPVKRGNWVVQRLLGERIPPPPPNVPELPADESKLGELTLREMLAQHRDNPACASCHERIDAIGLVFEGFGPVGELREVDLGGRPVSTDAVFPDGSEGSGVAGLRDYLRQQRQDEFVNNLCRKLLSYALGRTLILSDENVVQDARAALDANEYRFTALIDTIVTRPQFLNKRGRTQVAAKD